MKKMFVLLMFALLAMICSCQRHHSATEAQLAQRKTELDAREKALDEREKELALRETVLNERQRALAQKEKAIATAPTSSPGQLQRQGASDPAQIQAERERRVQEQLARFQGLIPDPEQAKAQMERNRQQLSERQRGLADPQRMRSGLGAPPTTAASSPPSLAVYPQPEAASPTPSPAVEAASPTPSPTPQ
jgi:hypothetical protein